MGVVTFDVANVGGGSTGLYTFDAELPTSRAYTYMSPPQASLSSGSHIINTLRFSQAVSGLIGVSLVASDNNQSNNYASQVINAPYTYNNYDQYGYNYSYQNQPPFYQLDQYPPAYSYQQYGTPNQYYQYSNQYPYAY